MEKEGVKQLLAKADASLEQASEERMRPAEDVVAFSICHNSRNSIRMYLMSYLMDKGEKPEANESVNELLKKCAEYDDKFSKIDISEIECGGSKLEKNSEYCLSINKVTNCFETATEVRKMILDLV